MRKSQLECQLVDALRNLERNTDNLCRSKGYNQESRKMKMLLELIKEQIQREDTLSTTRQTR